MKTFIQITPGDHLLNNVIDMLVTSVTPHSIKGYNLERYRSTGSILMYSIHAESFDNKLIVAGLQVTQPIERIASQEEFNNLPGLKPADMSSIEIY